MRVQIETKEKNFGTSHMTSYRLPQLMNSGRVVNSSIVNPLSKFFII